MGEEPLDPSAEPDNERRIDALLIQASVSKGRRDFRKAEALLDAAEAIAPEEARIFDLRGDIHAERDHYDTAVVCYRRALELNPELEDTEDKMGMASLGRMRAAKLAVRAGQSDPDEGKRIKRRSQIAMFGSLVCPGLGHLWLERHSRAAWFGIPAVALLIAFATWRLYPLLAPLIILWVVAFVDSARCATLREDEELF